MLDEVLSSDLLERLADEAVEHCKRQGWSREWQKGGCCLHLEASEFIEALRGKGDPVEEAGDVLFVLLSMLRYHKLNLREVIQAERQKIKQATA